MKLVEKLIYRIEHKVYLRLYKKANPKRIDTRLYCRYCKRLMCIFYGQRLGDVSNAWQCEPINKRISYPYGYSTMVNKCCDRKGKPIVREIRVDG